MASDTVGEVNRLASTSFHATNAMQTLHPKLIVCVAGYTWQMASNTVGEAIHLPRAVLHGTDAMQILHPTSSAAASKHIST